MAAVIQRVIALPGAGDQDGVRTEYLLSLEPETWVDKKREAHVFKTHGIADQLAAKLREITRMRRLETGKVCAAFIHARTIEANERNDYAAALEPPPLDAKRMAEVLRDPVEA